MFSLDFPFAYGSPSVQADFRSRLEDFRVEEDLGFAPLGEGEHIYLKLRKRGHNTQWAARQLASFADLPFKDVGYCGLKDRFAVTEQWFSLYDPKRKFVNWQAFQEPGIEIIETSRHQHKLKPGAHSANRFVIVLRNLSPREQGSNCEDHSHTLAQRLQTVAEAVPNYFGEQRFGNDASNLERAGQLFSEHGARGLQQIKDRKLRGLIISAARSYLFNLVLSAHVQNGSWNLVNRNLVDPNSEFSGTGPLWGRGRNPADAGDSALEQEILQPWHQWCDALEHVGLQQERRARVLRPQHFKAQVTDRDLQLSFCLAPGQYATAVLREIAVLNHHKHNQPQGDVQAENAELVQATAVV